jgi:hypothetical protein
MALKSLAGVEAIFLRNGSALDDDPNADPSLEKPALGRWSGSGKAIKVLSWYYKCTRGVTGEPQAFNGCLSEGPVWVCVVAVTIALSL